MSLDRPEWLSAVVCRVRLAGSDLVGRVVVDGEAFSGLAYVSTGVDSYEAVRVVDGEVGEAVDDPLLGAGPFVDLSVQEEEPGWDDTAPDWWHRGEAFTGSAITFTGDRVTRGERVENGVPGDRFDFSGSGAVVGCGVQRRVDPVRPGGVWLIRQSGRWSPSGEMRGSWTAFTFEPRGEVHGEVALFDSGELRVAGVTGGYFDEVVQHRGLLTLPVLEDLGVLREIGGVGDRLRLSLGDRSEEMVDRLVSGPGLGGVEHLSVIVYPGGLSGLRRLVAGRLPALRMLKVVPSAAIDEFALFELLLELRRRWGPGVEVGLDSWQLRSVGELPARGGPGYGFYFDEGFEGLIGVVGMLAPDRWPGLMAWVEASPSLRFVKVTSPGSLRRSEVREVLDRLRQRSEVTIIGPEVKPHDWVPEARERFAR